MRINHLEDWFLAQLCKQFRQRRLTLADCYVKQLCQGSVLKQNVLALDLTWGRRCFLDRGALKYDDALLALLEVVPQGAFLILDEVLVD